MGTRGRKRQVRGNQEDHPHAYGDKLYILYASIYLMGIIPTRVGTRLGRVFTGSQALDHPHACGDKSLCDNRLWRGKGSSPRVWGQVTPESATVNRYGIIPTRVGTRSASILSVRSAKDHPHACGDKKRYCYNIPCR